jgi:SAM-dependent methyltransferase
MLSKIIKTVVGTTLICNAAIVFADDTIDPIAQASTEPPQQAHALQPALAVAQQANSTEEATSTNTLLRPILNKIKIDLNAPIVGIGDDFQTVGYNLALNGAKKVYAVEWQANAANSKSQNTINNQLKEQNLQNINFVTGDVSNSPALKPILATKNIALVAAVNTMQNWPSNKIEKTIKTFHTSLKPGGTLLLTIKNNLIDEKLPESFFKEAYTTASNDFMNNSQISDANQLNKNVTQLFQKIKQIHPEYELLPSSYLHNAATRLNLYPFEMKCNTNTAAVEQLLFPENMKLMLQTAGFKNIEIGNVDESGKVFYVMGSK